MDRIEALAVAGNKIDFSPAEGSHHQEFHGARPVLGVHGWQNTAAALDQAWQHVAHLCVACVQQV